MPFVVECRMPPPDVGHGPKFVSAASLDDAIVQARKWIRTYNGEADIYDDSDPPKLVLKHAQIAPDMD